MLTVPARTHYVFYGESASSIGMDLSSMRNPQPAVAVDTKKKYHEIKIGMLKAKEHVWKAPYRSDWAIAVEDFAK